MHLSFLALKIIHRSKQHLRYLLITASGGELSLLVDLRLPSVLSPAPAGYRLPVYLSHVRLARQEEQQPCHEGLRAILPID